MLMGGKEGGVETQVHRSHGQGDMLADDAWCPCCLSHGRDAPSHEAWFPLVSNEIELFFQCLLAVWFFSVPFMYITCSFLYLNDLRILPWKLQLPVFSRSVNYTSSPSSGLVLSFCSCFPLMWESFLSLKLSDYRSCTSGVSRLFL